MAGTVIADNLQAASTSQLVIKNGVANTPPTIQDSGGTQVGTFCRAWVNFNGQGTSSPFTIANGFIRASFNVSSVTDDGVGSYTINFTNAMPDANYSVVGMAGGTTNIVCASTTRTASSFTGTTVLSGANSAYDASFVNYSVFR